MTNKAVPKNELLVLSGVGASFRDASGTPWWPAAKPCDIAKACSGLSAARVRSALYRLKAKGLVEKIESRGEYWLTEAGKQLLNCNDNALSHP